MFHKGKDKKGCCSGRWWVHLIIVIVILLAVFALGILVGKIKMKKAYALKGAAGYSQGYSQLDKTSAGKLGGHNMMFYKGDVDKGEGKFAGHRMFNKKLGGDTMIVEVVSVDSDEQITVKLNDDTEKTVMIGDYTRIDVSSEDALSDILGAGETVVLMAWPTDDGGLKAGAIHLQ